MVATLVSVGHAMELDALTIFNFDGEALVHRYGASMQKERNSALKR